MVYGWQPKTKELEDNLTEAETRLRTWSQPQRQWQPPVKPYELPKKWWGEVEEKIGEGISKVPILPKVLEPVGKAFSWIHEEVEKPFAAIITSPFSPDLQWKKGESWKDHIKREYDAWEAPAYVKGLSEFAMPLWWMPWFGWAAKGAKALGTGTKVVSALAKGIKGATTFKLPSGELLDQVLFKGNRLTRAMENVPVVNKVVKMIGGEAAFAHPTSQAPLQIARRELVKLGKVHDMRSGVRRLHVPKLQVIGKVETVLGMDSKGVVKNIVDKTGQSQYLYDVLEGAMKNPDNYKFVTKEAKQYVETLGKILDDVYSLAKKEGVKVPKGRMLHRIVKGKETKLGYEASEYGSLFEMSRSHKLMKGGVDVGVDYGLSVNESVSSTIDHYVREIARKRFTKEVGKLGKTPKQMWEQLPESSELTLLHAAEKEAVLMQPERLKELILMKKDFMKRLGGQQILGEQMAKFNRHPVFKNAIFPKDVVKTTEKILNDTGQDWLRTMANISGTSRMLTAAMDLSAPFIQGATVFGRNPVAWVKSVKNMLEFAIKPDNFYKYLADPKVMAVASERIMYGGSAATFEFFEALAPLQRAIGKLPGGKKFAEKAVGQTYGRAEAAFTGFGEVARNEMWKALRRPNMAENELMDLARTVDRMTGVMSTEALGIGRTQMDFENAFVFFAPRYTRAGLAMVGDVLKRGATGAEARKAIGGLAGGGLSMYYGICKALDQQPDLNPNSGRFMTIKVGESHIGVGGIMTALVRLAYDIGITAAEDPINLVKPLSEGKLNRWDNPFIRFMYARTAPLTSTVYSSVVEQANYFGEPFEDVGDWAKFMADKVTPIAMQNLMRDPQLATGIAEFGGLRAFPKSPWELLDDERNELSMREHGQPYDNLNDLQQTEIDRSDTVLTLQRDVDAQTVTRGDAVSIGFLNRQRERESARQTYEDTLNKLQRAYDDGAIDGVDFREEMSNAGYGLGTTYEHIDKQPEYKEVLETLKKPKKIQDKHLVDIAYSEFMDTLYKEGEFEDQYGLFQYDKYNAYIEQFKVKYGGQVYQYVLDMKAERDRNLPPLAQEYQRAKEVMKPYWAAQSRVEQMFGLRFAESPRGQSLITKLRKTIRMQNPDVERFYQLFYARS